MVILQEVDPTYPPVAFSGDVMASDAAAFREDGEYGRYRTGWLNKALEASKRRREGAYEEYLAEYFAQTWAEEKEELSEEE